MSVQTAVSVLIGAELGGSFKGAFTGAQKQIGSLGSVIKDLNSKSANIGAFKALGNDVLTSGQKFRAAEAEVKRLAAEIGKTDKPTKALQASYRAAQKEVTLCAATHKAKRPSRKWPIP